MQDILMTQNIQLNLILFSYTQENVLNTLCYWLGTSHRGQYFHCHMQVLITGICKDPPSQYNMQHNIITAQP